MSYDFERYFVRFIGGKYFRRARHYGYERVASSLEFGDSDGGAVFSFVQTREKDGARTPGKNRKNPRKVAEGKAFPQAGCG